MRELRQINTENNSMVVVATHDNRILSPKDNILSLERCEYTLTTSLNCPASAFFVDNIGEQGGNKFCDTETCPNSVSTIEVI